MADFNVDGIAYKCGKLDAIACSLLVKRAWPIIRFIRENIVSGEPIGTGVILDAAQSLADADVLYIYDTCLSQVQRKRGEAWEAIWNPQIRRPQHDDISPKTLVDVSMKVLTVNLASFSGTPPLNT